MTLGERDSWGVRAKLLAPHLPRAQLQYVGMNNTGIRASDPFPETLPGDTEAPGTAARGLFRAKAAPEAL